MKLFILLVLLLITFVSSDKENLENEVNGEDASPAIAQGRRAMKCIKSGKSCLGNEDGCCLLSTCECWEERKPRKSTNWVKKCQCVQPELFR